MNHIYRLLRQAKTVRYNVVELNGNKLGVRWEYIPEVPEVRYYADGSGQPGEPAELDVKLIVDLKTLIPVECKDWTESQWETLDQLLWPIIEKEQEEYWNQYAEDVNFEAADVMDSILGNS